MNRPAPRPAPNARPRTQPMRPDEFVPESDWVTVEPGQLAPLIKQRADENARKQRSPR